MCAFPFHFFNRFVSTSCILSVRVFFSLLLLMMIFFLVLFWCRIVLIWLVRSFFNSPIDGCRWFLFFCTSLLFYFVVRMCTACTCVFAICRGRKFLVNCFTFVVAPSNIPMQYYVSERPKTDNIFRCLYILGVYIARTKNSFLCAKTINIVAYIGISIAQQNPTSYTSSTLNCIFWYTNHRSSLFLHKILTARHLTNQSVHIFFIRLCCAVRALFCWLCKCSF